MDRCRSSSNPFGLPLQRGLWRTGRSEYFCRRPASAFDPGEDIGISPVRTVNSTEADVGVTKCYVEAAASLVLSLVLLITVRTEHHTMTRCSRRSPCLPLVSAQDNIPVEPRLRDLIHRRTGHLDDGGVVGDGLIYLLLLRMTNTPVDQ